MLPPDARRLSFDPRDGGYRHSGLRRLWIATVAIVFVLCLSSFGYWLLGQAHHHGTLDPPIEEPWNGLDCLYMTVVTISTIGYTETLPLDPGQSLEDFSDVRIYTMAIIMLAMLLVGFSVSSATAFLIEGDLIKFWARRRAMKDASKLSGHYIVCGGGVTGEVIVRELAETKHDVVVIEIDPERAERVRQEFGVTVLVGDAMNDGMLEAAGIDRAEGLAAALPNDRDNVFLIITAKNHKKNGLRVVSLASSEEVAEKIFSAGADAVVAASYIGGMRIASELFRPAVTSFLDVMLRGRDEAVRFAQITLGASWEGKTLRDLDLGGRCGLPVLALRGPEEEEFVFNPQPSETLQAGSVVVTMGESKVVKKAQAAER